MDRNDQEFLVQKIRTQYTEREHTQLDTLKQLDRKVKRPAQVFGVVFGIVGALVLGAGMCFAMNVIEPGTYFGVAVGENMILPGILIGLLGILMVCVNWPICKGLLSSRRKKYAGEIIRLSDNITKG